MAANDVQLVESGRRRELPPPLWGRAGEGGSPGRRRLWFTPLPTLLRSVDLPLKGGGDASSNYGGGVPSRPNSLRTAAAEFPTLSTVRCNSSFVTPRCLVQ